MNSNIFLKPRMTGSRFEGPAIPLELLKDFAALEEMIKEVAKWKLKNEHPDRQRVPKGFMRGTELRLSALESGSAIATLGLFLEGLPPLTHLAYLEQARELILDAIEAAGKGASALFLPKALLSYFDRFGRGLREGEVMELTSPQRVEPVFFDKEIRRRLVTAASMAQFTEETTIRGLIPELDQQNKTFEILTLDGRRIVAPLHLQHAETVREGFAGYEKGLRVQVQGIGRFSSLRKLETFESVEHVVCLDPLDLHARLDELTTLRQGWLDGKAGRALDLQGLEWLRQSFDEKYPDDLPLPYLYPTAEGGIQAEWSIGRTEISLDIDLASRKGFWHALELDSKVELARDLTLDSPATWEWISNVLRPGSSGP